MNFKSFVTELNEFCRESNPTKKSQLWERISGNDVGSLNAACLALSQSLTFPEGFCQAAHTIASPEFRDSMLSFCRSYESRFTSSENSSELVAVADALTRGVATLFASATAAAETNQRIRRRRTDLSESERRSLADAVLQNGIQVHPEVWAALTDSRLMLSELPLWTYYWLNLLDLSGSASISFATISSNGARLFDLTFHFLRQNLPMESCVLWRHPENALLTIKQDMLDGFGRARTCTQVSVPMLWHIKCKPAEIQSTGAISGTSNSAAAAIAMNWWLRQSAGESSKFARVDLTNVLVIGEITKDAKIRQVQGEKEKIMRAKRWNQGGPANPIKRILIARPGECLEGNECLTPKQLEEIKVDLQRSVRIDLLDCDSLEEGMKYAFYEPDTYEQRSDFYRRKSYEPGDQFALDKAQKEVQNAIDGRISRVITLTGFSGIGKTHGAFKLTQQILESHVDSGVIAKCVYFRSSDPLYSSGSAASSILRELRLQPTGRAEADTAKVIDAINKITEKSPLILMLDRFEACLNTDHAEACHILTSLLQVKRAHSLIVLVVSCNVPPLLESEQSVYEVTELSCPDPADLSALERIKSHPAVLLFCQQADIKLENTDDEGYRLVARCVRELQGVPLFIEWLAPHANRENIGNLLGKITTDILNGPKSAQLNHTTYDKFFNYVFESLKNDEKTLFCFLGIFSADSGWSEDTAIQIAGDLLPKARYEQAMQALKDKRLIIEIVTQAGKRGRFGGFVGRAAQRQFVQWTEAKKYRQLFLDFYHRFSQVQKGWYETSDEKRHAWLTSVNSEFSNVLVALSLVPDDTVAQRMAAEIASAFWRYYDCRAPYSAGLSLLRPFIEDTPPSDFEVRASIHAAYGMLLYRIGRFAMAAHQQREALECLGSLDEEHQNQFQILMKTAIAHNDCGIAMTARDCKEASEHLVEAEAILLRIRDDVNMDLSEENRLWMTRTQATVLNNIGMQCRYLGKFDEATEALLESERLFKEIGRTSESGFPKYQRAKVLTALGEYESARELAADVAESTERTPATRSINLLGRLFLHLGNMTDAVIEHSKASERHTKAANLLGVHKSNQLIALAYLVDRLRRIAPSYIKTHPLPSLTLLNGKLEEICELAKHQPSLDPSTDRAEFSDTLQRGLTWLFGIEDYLSVVEQLEVMSLHAYVSGADDHAQSLDRYALALRKRLGYAYPMTEGGLKSHLEHRLHDDRLPVRVKVTAQRAIQEVERFHAMPIGQNVLIDSVTSVVQTNPTDQTPLRVQMLPMTLTIMSGKLEPSVAQETI